MKEINLIPNANLSNLSADAKSAEDLNRKGATIRYALTVTPTGKNLFTYWLAVLTILGAFTPARNEFRNATAMRFFRSRSTINHHTKAGNLVPTRPGYSRLTETGYRYYQGRIKGYIKGQEVDQKDLRFYTAVAFMGTRAKTSSEFAKHDGRFSGLRDSDLRAVDIGN